VTEARPMTPERLSARIAVLEVDLHDADALRVKAEAEATRLRAELDRAQRELAIAEDETARLMRMGVDARDEARRWRSRCPVIREDITGLRGEQVAAWLTQAGTWTQQPSVRPDVLHFVHEDSLDAVTVGVRSFETAVDQPRCRLETVRLAAAHAGLPEQDVLAEMLSIEVES